MLEVRIEKRFAGFHLRAEFTAERETLALLGASGAGKTMTLQCLAGLIKPDRGYIALDGRVWFDSDRHIWVPPQERGVGLLFQNYALFPNMTVRQNLLCGVRQQIPRKQRDAEVARLVRRFCLEGLEEHRAAQLSGGQQQRVALARCLARGPGLLLLDEPFAALDRHLRWKLEQELQKTLLAFQGTTLYVTHDTDETRRLCKRVCVMHRGLTQPAVPVSEWYRAPATRSAAQLAGFENMADAAATGDSGRAVLGDWGVSWPAPRGAVAAAFRAQDATLGDGQEEFAICCRMMGTTELETLCTPVDRPDCFIRACRDERHTVGETVWLTVPPERVAWLKEEETVCGRPL